MRNSKHLPESRFRVNWAKLNNELFGRICSDPELRAQYERADWTEAQNICADQFDALVSSASDFIDRFVVLE